MEASLKTISFGPFSDQHLFFPLQKLAAARRELIHSGEGSEAQHPSQ